MAHRMVTVALPDALYERARETAARASISLEQALTQFIALSLPVLEDDLPAEMRSELAALPSFSRLQMVQEEKYFLLIAPTLLQLNLSYPATIQMT